MSTQDAEHHALKGFRLTTQSMIELVAAVVLYMLCLVLAVVSFMSWRFNSDASEAARQFASRQFTAAQQKAEQAVASRGTADVMALSATAALEVGKFDVAATALTRLEQTYGSDSPAARKIRAVLLLSDPKTATKPTTPSEAEKLLGGVDDPDARVMLGQLLLNRGDAAGAEKLFKAALSPDSPRNTPTAQACMVARNGLGVCKLLGDHRRMAADHVLSALEEFVAATGYQRPWAAPWCNRDRAAAIWLRALIRERGNDFASLAAALGRLERELNFRLLTPDYMNSEVQRVATEVVFPEKAMVAVESPGGAVQLTLGFFKHEPLQDNRQRYLFNAMGMVQSRLALSGADGSLIAKQQSDARFFFDNAQRPDEKYWAPRFNQTIASLRQFVKSATGIERRSILNALTPNLEFFAQNLELLPPDQRGQAIVARYVLLSEAPESLPGLSLRSADELSRYLTDNDPLAKLETSGAARKPSSAWLQFQRDHIRVVNTYWRLPQSQRNLAAIKALLPFAQRLAAHLSLDAPPPGTEGLGDPERVGEGPQLRRPVQYADVANLIRLYAETVRVCGDSLAVQAGNLTRGGEAWRDCLRTERDLCVVRMRLAAYFDQWKTEFLGATPALIELELARARLSQIDRDLQGR